MKPQSKLAIAIFTALFFGAIVIKSPLLRAQLETTPPVSVQNPVPVVVNPTPKQYKVVDIGRIPIAKGQTAAGTLEIVLNEMGNSGWSIVATSGTFVIMMQ